MSERGELYGGRGVVFVWFPIVGPIAAWAVHIVYLGAIARFTCTEPTSEWTIHLVTAGWLLVGGGRAPPARLLVRGAPHEAGRTTARGGPLLRGRGAGGR